LFTALTHGYNSKIFVDGRKNETLKQIVNRHNPKVIILPLKEVI